MAKACGEETIKAEFVTAFVSLLKDQESEVKTAAAAQVPGSKHCLNSIVQHSVNSCFIH